MSATFRCQRPQDHRVESGALKSHRKSGRTGPTVVATGGEMSSGKAHQHFQRQVAQKRGTEKDVTGFSCTQT